LKIGFGALTLVVAIAGLGLLAPMLLPEARQHLPPLPARPVFTACWLLALGAIAFAWLRFRPGRAAFAAGVTALAAMIYLYLVALPATEALRGQRSFATAVRDAVAAEDGSLALYRTRDIVYYLDSPYEIAEYETEADLAVAVHQGRVRWLILREQDCQRLNLPLVVTARARSFDWDGTANRTILARCEPTGR